MIENPLFSHTFPSHHPTYQFKNVFVADKDVIGGGDSGMVIVEVGFDTRD